MRSWAETAMKTPDNSMKKEERDPFILKKGAYPILKIHWSLIMGERKGEGYLTVGACGGGGGASKVLPQQKGKAKRVLAMLKGEAQHVFR